MATHRIRIIEPGCPPREETFADTVTVGRSSECSVLIDEHDLEVSKVHLRLGIEPEGVWVQDLDSANGTRVDGGGTPLC